jgi:hypothetical protein
LPDSLGAIYQNGKNIPKNHRIYQIAINYDKKSQNRPNGHIIYQRLSLQDPSKFTQIGIFGLKICHLATLLPMLQKSQQLQFAFFLSAKKT